VGQVSISVNANLVEACDGVIGASRVSNPPMPVGHAPFQSRRSLGRELETFAEPPKLGKGLVIPCHVQTLGLFQTIPPTLIFI
jgi:hypothetical protein